jgi:hypothetical protein
MGVLTNLIGMKQAQDQKATQNALDALTLIYKDEKATPENKQWAADSIRDLTNTIFGGGKKAGGGGGSPSGMAGGGGGGKGKAGTGIGDIFHGVLSTLAKANPYTPSQNTKETLQGIGSKRPTGHLEMSEDEYQAKQDQLEQHKKDIEIRNNMRAEAIKAQQKASQDEEAYNTEYKRATDAGLTPQQAYERASSIAAGKTPTDVLKAPAGGAGKNATIVGPDGKEFVGVSRQMPDGSTQLFKIGSTEPLDPATYSEKVKEPADVSSLRGYEEDLNTLKDPSASPSKKEAAKLDLRDRQNKNQAVTVRIQNEQQQAQPAAPGTMDTLAKQYVDSGGTITPPLSFRGGDRRAFDDAVARQINSLKASGQDTSLIERKVNIGAAKSAIDVLAKTDASLSGQEKGTIAEIDRAKTLAKKVSRTAFKKFNNIQQFLDANLTDDPDLARFREALVSVRQRYSAMVSNLRGAGTATNAVRAETAEEILDRAMATGALDAALDEMKTGIGNITGGVKGALKEKQGEFKGLLTGQSNTPPPVEDLRKKYNY